MIADEYFDLRSRLGAALFSLGGLADRAGLRPSRAPLLKSLTEGLRDPFVFVVAGEVNAGKSSLLNALFGEEFCRTGVLPETRRIHYFRYGRTPRHHEAGPLLDEIDLPHAFLRDFHVVDTPGVNSIEAGHDGITGHFIPRADAVLYCFPATNPWSGAAWDFLGRIHREWLKKIVLVLQQSDLRTPEETAAIADHMRKIGRERLGVDLPVFPVSARLALLARTSGLDKPRLLAESAFPAFEQTLTKIVAGAAPRLGKLVSACSTAQGLLAEVQSRLATDADALARLTLLRDQVGTTLDETGTATGLAAGETVQSLRAAWNETTAGELTAALTERRRFPGLMLGRDPTADHIESRLLPPLLSKVRGLATGFESALDQTMGRLWQQPGSALHRTLEGHVRRPPEPAWPARGGVFLPSMENAACDAVAGSGLAAFWQERLRRRQGLMRGLTLMVLLPLILLAAGTATGSLPGMAALWLPVLLIAGVLAGRALLRRETAQTAALAGELLAAAGDQCTAAARPLIEAHGERRLADFHTFTAPLDTAIQTREAAAAPLEAETDQLARTLQSLARTFHAGHRLAPETTPPQNQKV